jgi:methylmalonyl-CoA/ethylmalonyl-CoA epimerase
VIFRIDHVGLVAATGTAVGSYLEALRMRAGDRGPAEEYGVLCEFWRSSDDPLHPTIEVVTPTRPDSAVTNHLARHGPGLHHVAFEVDDLAIELARLRNRGFAAIDRAPCRGARPAMRVAFAYAPRPAGLLVELVQYGRR